MSSGLQLGRIQLVLDVGYDAANRPPVEKSASTHVSANAPANSSAVVRAPAKLRTAARESYSARGLNCRADRQGVLCRTGRQIIERAFSQPEGFGFEVNRSK